MKYFVLLIVSVIILTGCAREALHADHEYGVAQNDAFDRQIVHRDYTHANKPTEGMAGIHAETTMDVYHGTFADSFSSEDIDITATGAE